MTIEQERILEREHLAGSAPQVAPRLLGTLLRHRTDAGDVVARIVEVEAYGPDDPASHSAAGCTPRCRSMFGPPGTAYVYRSYGVHWCVNVVVDRVGVGAAVLLRAAEVEAGEPQVRRRRPHVEPVHQLLRGPGCLTQGLAIDAALDGADLCGGTALVLEDDGNDPGEVSRGPRIGVSQAAERPWRFWITGARAVSRYRRSPRAPRPDGPS